jgi:Domain of unknown function (DUF5666)
MKRLFTALVAPALAVASLGAGVATTALASATVRGHATMAKTWHGTVEKLNATMGTTESFTVKVGKDLYTVHYDAMTHWIMGSKKDLKAGAMVAVKGTVKGMTIAASSLSL